MSSFWGLVSGVKSSLDEALSVAQSDLSEFARVIQTDTHDFFSKDGSAPAARGPDSDASVSDTPSEGRRRETLSNRRMKLRTSYSTYKEPVLGDDFEEWCSNFELDGEYLLESKEMLLSSEILEIHHALVPSSVSSAVFWQRYFYRVSQLNAEELKRQVNVLLFKAWCLHALIQFTGNN